MKKLLISLLALFFALQVTANATEKTTEVTIDNFTRAESDTMLRQSLATMQKLFNAKIGNIVPIMTI